MLLDGRYIHKEQMDLTVEDLAALPQPATMIK
jgi:hypothetical protein